MTGFDVWRGRDRHQPNRETRHEARFGLATHMADTEVKIGMKATPWSIRFVNNDQITFMGGVE